jgi:hypothetical protein
MSDEQSKETKLQVKTILVKLDLLRNFLIISDEGMRQQQSAANDEIIIVLRGINDQLNNLIQFLDK